MKGNKAMSFDDRMIQIYQYLEQGDQGLRFVLYTYLFFVIIRSIPRACHEFVSLLIGILSTSIFQIIQFTTDVDIFVFDVTWANVLLVISMILISPWACAFMIYMKNNQRVELYIDEDSLEFHKKNLQYFVALTAIPFGIIALYYYIGCFIYLDKYSPNLVLYVLNTLMIPLICWCPKYYDLINYENEMESYYESLPDTRKKRKRGKHKKH